jgi:hypothetical protein
VCPAPVQQSCERALREPLLTQVEVGERTASSMSLCRPPICLSLTNKLVPMFSRYSASSAMGAVRCPPPRHLTVHSPPSPPPSFPRHALPTTLKRIVETCGHQEARTVYVLPGDRACHRSQGAHPTHAWPAWQRQAALLRWPCSVCPADACEGAAPPSVPCRREVRRRRNRRRSNTVGGTATEREWSCSRGWWPEDGGAV